MVDEDSSALSDAESSTQDEEEDVEDGDSSTAMEDSEESEREEQTGGNRDEVSDYEVYISESYAMQTTIWASGETVESF